MTNVIQFPNCPPPKLSTPEGEFAQMLNDLEIIDTIFADIIADAWSFNLADDAEWFAVVAESVRRRRRKLARLLAVKEF